MGDPIWLPEVLRAKGLVVHEVAGWRDRGHGDFGNIWGVVCHHTGSFGATANSIAFHPELGLASQLFLSPQGEYTICGAGVAWHAGQGSWPGLPANAANQYTIGIEAANDGGGSPGRPHRSSWSDEQYNAYVLGVSAILEKIDQPASHAIGHKEWAGPAQGKWDPGAIDMNIFRSDVVRLFGQGGDAPMSAAEVKQITDFVAGYCGPIGSDVKDIREQLAGAGARDSGEYSGWPQLDNKTVVDGLAQVLHNQADIQARLTKLEGKA
jgi:hypothetical protein